MDAQLALFDADTKAQPIHAAKWHQLPDEARAKARDLFAALAVKIQQPATEKDERDEPQREN